VEGEAKEFTARGGKERGIALKGIYFVHLGEGVLCSLFIWEKTKERKGTPILGKNGSVSSQRVFGDWGKSRHTGKK